MDDFVETFVAERLMYCGSRSLFWDTPDRQLGSRAAVLELDRRVVLEFDRGVCDQDSSFFMLPREPKLDWCLVIVWNGVRSVWDVVGREFAGLHYASRE